MSSIEDLKALDRAAATPFVNYPVTPSWYPPLAGAWFSVLAAATTLMSVGSVIGWMMLAADCVELLVFTAWYRRRWGTWPDMRRAPAEIAHAYRIVSAWILAVAAAAVVVCWLGGPLIGAAVTFVASTALIWWYERRLYPAACDQVRARLG